MTNADRDADAPLFPALTGAPSPAGDQSEAAGTSDGSGTAGPARAPARTAVSPSGMTPSGPGGAWERVDGRGGPAASRRPPAGPFSASRGQVRRPAGRIVLAGLLLITAAVLVIAGVVLRAGGTDPAADVPQAEFELPAGWTDRTDELADRVPEVQPDYVFQGPATDGFTADLNVVRQPLGAQDPPLPGLVALISEQVVDRLDAERVGETVELELGGTPALAYDYRYEINGMPVRARQVTAVRGDSVVFLNFTAHETAFDEQVPVVDALAGSWRWDA